MDRPWKLFFAIGIIFILISGVLFLLNSVNISKLPGDIVIHKKNFTLYFPIGISILVSIILSVLFYFLRYWKL